jgi:cytochrome P450
MTDSLASHSTDAEALLADILFGDASADPYDRYRELRETAPALVTRQKVLVLSRYDDVCEVLRLHAAGKAEEAFGVHTGKLPTQQLRAAMRWWRRTVLFSNPPGHTRLRRLISEAFTPRHVEQLRASAVAAADEALHRLAAADAADFIRLAALPLPVTVIAGLLGVPSSDWPGFAPVVRDMVEIFEPFADAATLTRAIAAQQQLVSYFADLLARKRRTPADDLLSRLAASHAADALDDEEMIGTAILLFAAGYETTTNLLGNGLYALLTHPSQMAALRRQPQLIPRAVEEFLRFDPPAQLTSRTILQPCAVAGTGLSPGQIVLLLLAAANRDPAKFTDPDRLDITRDQGPSLAFGTGPHFCLGAHLARLEGAEFFTRLLRRYPRIELAGTPRRRHGRSLRGFAELPISVRP